MDLCQCDPPRPNVIKIRSCQYRITRSMPVLVLSVLACCVNFGSLSVVGLHYFFAWIHSHVPPSCMTQFLGWSWLLCGSGTKDQCILSLVVLCVGLPCM